MAIKGTLLELVEEAKVSLKHWKEFGRDNAYAVGIKNRFGVSAEVLEAFVQLFSK